MGGQFNNKNAGKRGISLNIRHPKGLQIAKDLVRICDIVAEGFSPGVLQRLGLGYDVMKKHPSRHHLHPAIRHGRARHLRPDAHGRPGRGGVRRPGRHVRACRSRRCRLAGAIRSSTGWVPMATRWRCLARCITAIAPARANGSMRHSANPDLFLTGTTILDWSANGREWRRYGNRSPYKPAAPHGAYRCAGQGPLGGHRLLHRSGMARGRRGRGPSRMAAMIRASPRWPTAWRTRTRWTRAVGAWTVSHDRYE